MKVCEYQTNSTILLHYLHEQHNRYLAEVEQLSAPLGKAIDLAENSSIGCRRCDRRACIVDKTPVAAILRMRDQITF